MLPGVACCTVITAARPRSVEWYLQVLRKWARHASLSTNSKHFQQVSKVFWDLLFSLAVPFQGRLNERFRCRHPHQITVKLSMAETSDLPRKHYCPLMRGIRDTVDMDGYGRLMYSDSCLCHPPTRFLLSPCQGSEKFSHGSYHERHLHFSLLFSPVGFGQKG